MPIAIRSWRGGEEEKKRKKEARRAMLKSNLTTLTWQVGKKLSPSISKSMKFHLRSNFNIAQNLISKLSLSTKLKTVTKLDYNETIFDFNKRPSKKEQHPGGN